MVTIVANVATETPSPRHMTSEGLKWATIVLWRKTGEYLYKVEMSEATIEECVVTFEFWKLLVIYCLGLLTVKCTEVAVT